jgi:hypothetical protein
VPLKSTHRSLCFCCLSVEQSVIRLGPVKKTNGIPFMSAAAPSTPSARELSTPQPYSGGTKSLRDSVQSGWTLAADAALLKYISKHSAEVLEKAQLIQNQLEKLSNSSKVWPRTSLVHGNVSAVFGL